MDSSESTETHARHSNVSAIRECPYCAYFALKRSHVRWYERWRKLITTSRPYRCMRCRRRSWHEPKHDRAEVQAEEQQLFSIVVADDLAF